MTELVRIPLAGGGVILVESGEPAGDGPVKAGRARDRVHDAAASMQELLTPVTEAAEAVLSQLGGARPDELEVEFGIALSAEAGAVITKTAVGGNLKVKMKWRRDDPPLAAVPEEPDAADQP
jgi:hypothetical protein